MKTELPLEKRIRVLADALGVLQGPGGFLECTSRFLALLGNAAGADRAYYFKHNLDEDPPTCSQRCEWVRDGVSHEIHNQTLQRVSYELLLPGALPVLSVGAPYLVVTSDAPTPLKQNLEDQRIKSLVLVPMLAGSTLLGFIGLDDCHHERSWASEDLEFLRVASAGLAGALLRARAEADVSARAGEVSRSRRISLSLMEDAQRAAAAAQEANRAKSDFLAMMSHEIRTPLNGVIGFTDLLLGEALPPRQAEMLATIRSCGSSLLALINDILDLSKIESGKLGLDLAPCRLLDCVSEVAAAFEPTLRDRDLAIEQVVSDGLPEHVLADDKRLRQILFNLVGNAVKFTRSGTITVRLSAEEISDVRFFLVCEVEDSGIGIPAADLDTIFDPFAHAQNVTHRQFGGSGLGLAIVRKLLGAMGGDISARSTLGKGSVFTFRLPLLLARQPEAAAPAPPMASEPPRTLRLLAVDDVPTNLRLLAGILKKFGCEVDVASDGHEAVEMARARAYDLIFMDILMPACDGVEATLRIRDLEREDPGRRPASIVALTADAFAENRDRCLAAGMDDFLTKPVKMDAIRAAVERVAGRSGPAG